MKRRVIQTFIVLCFGSILCVAPLGANNNLESDEQPETLLTVNTEQVIETEISIEQNANSIVSTGNDIQQNEIDIVSEKIFEAQQRINALECEDTMEWFKKYKEIQDEYSEWIDKDETIYDYFDGSELDLLFHIVETEVRGEDNFDEKVNVASVIFNRIDHEDFPMNLIEILTERPQFSSYISGDYKNVTVTETTILACEYAFQFPDTTNGALWFDSTRGNSWADRNREYIFTDSVGHSFYR